MPSAADQPDADGLPAVAVDEVPAKASHPTPTPTADQPTPQAPARHPWRSRRTVLVIGSLVVIVAATLGVGVGALATPDRRGADDQAALGKAAADWVALLLTIPEDPLAGNAQMEEMKRRTADPLHSRFEPAMARYFQDFALLTDPPPHVTSVSLLQAGAVGTDPPSDPSTTVLLVTTSIDAAHRDRGYGFRVDVIARGGQYFIADFRAAQ